MGGDWEILKLLGTTFLEDAPRIMQKLETAVRERDGEKIHFFAHKINGLASNFDGHATCQRAIELEMLGRQKNYEQVERAYRLLVEQLQLLKTAIVQYILEEQNRICPDNGHSASNGHSVSNGHSTSNGHGTSR